MKAHIHPSVKLGKNVEIGDYVVVGYLPKGVKEGELETTIGDNAIIRSHTVIYAGNRIGKNFQTGHHVLIREENTIGDDVSIGTSTVLEHHVSLGHRVRLHSQVFVPEYSVIEEGAWVGPRAVLTNALYPLSRGVKDSLKGPLIRRNAKIGANATILPGIELGENCLVGAGAVVTKNVESGSVVAGNPAREINQVKDLPYE